MATAAPARNGSQARRLAAMERLGRAGTRAAGGGSKASLADGRNAIGRTGASPAAPRPGPSASHRPRSSGSSTLSKARRPGRSPASWSTSPIAPARATWVSRGENFDQERPRKRTSPTVGRQSPARVASRVDFPDPERPRIASDSPAARVRLTRSTAVIGPRGVG